MEDGARLGGAFGGREINRPLVWLAFCGAFLLGLADLRRPLSLRNLDLLVLLSFSISLWFFNRGEVFWSVPLAYPPLVYLAARLTWIGLRGRKPGSGGDSLWPIWVLVAATVFLLGFRVGLNVEASNVIDVGYSGVVGAHRIANGQAPYGNFPTREGRACEEADEDGDMRDHIQTNGRCESANERGDTYGPVAYEAYVPGYLLFGWDGNWDGGMGAPADGAFHGDALGRALPRRPRARRDAASGGSGSPRCSRSRGRPTRSRSTSRARTRTTRSCRRCSIWGFWLASVPAARGAFVALAGWTKFASLIVAPLWWRYGRDGSRPVGRAAFAAGFAVASAAAFSVLLLEPDPLRRGAHVRRAHARLAARPRVAVLALGLGAVPRRGHPRPRLVQRVLQVVLVVAAVALAWVPRRLSPLQLAALTGALLVGFELVLTHWSYLYIPWFFPFAAFALLAPGLARPAAPGADGTREHEARELVAAG